MGVPKILGPYKPALAHLYQFTKPENCLNFTQPHMKCEIAKIHTHLFASQNALVLISNDEAGRNYNTFPGFQMDRPVGSFEFNNCQLHQIMSTTTVK